MLRHNQDAIKHSLRGNGGLTYFTFETTERDIISLLLMLSRPFQLQQVIYFLNEEETERDIMKQLNNRPKSVTRIIILTLSMCYFLNDRVSASWGS